MRIPAFVSERVFRPVGADGARSRRAVGRWPETVLRPPRTGILWVGKSPSGSPSRCSSSAALPAFTTASPNGRRARNPAEVRYGWCPTLRRAWPCLRLRPDSPPPVERRVCGCVGIGRHVRPGRGSNCLRRRSFAHRLGDSGERCERCHCTGRGVDGQSHHAESAGASLAPVKAL